MALTRAHLHRGHADQMHQGPERISEALYIAVKNAKWRKVTNKLSIYFLFYIYFIFIFLRQFLCVVLAWNLFDKQISLKLRDLLACTSQVPWLNVCASAYLVYNKTALLLFTPEMEKCIYSKDRKVTVHSKYSLTNKLQIVWKPTNLANE